MKKLARTFNEHVLVHSSGFDHVCLRKTCHSGGTVSSGCSSHKWKMRVYACIYMKKPQSWDIRQAFACPLSRSCGCVRWILLVWRRVLQLNSSRLQKCHRNWGLVACGCIWDLWVLLFAWSTGNCNFFDRLDSLLWPVTFGAVDSTFARFFSSVFFFFLRESSLCHSVVLSPRW